MPDYTASSTWLYCVESITIRPFMNNSFPVESYLLPYGELSAASTSGLYPSSKTLYFRRRATKELMLEVTL
jgi:hypothetical protein